jgi:hypothetical protein
VCATLVLSVCVPALGCTESSFVLSYNSRLPRWFQDAGVARQDAVVTLDYYNTGRSIEARFRLMTRAGRTVATAVGQRRNQFPVTLGPDNGAPTPPWPNYEIITVDGITDVIDQRAPEPIFFVTDDPEVKRRLGVP